jgi:hypothetical protein
MAVLGRPGRNLKRGLFAAVATEDGGRAGNTELMQEAA